jgi:hypothetical protein
LVVVVVVVYHVNDLTPLVRGRCQARWIKDPIVTVDRGGDKEDKVKRKTA